MSQQFRYLFTPLKVGSVTVRNRIVQTGHSKSYGDRVDGCVLASERDVYYQAERAKGGVGLQIMGYQMVHPTSDGGLLRSHTAYRKEQVTRYKMIADAVHEHGGVIFSQACHLGIQSNVDQEDEYHQVWAPSAISGLAPISKQRVAKEMEIEDIKAVVDGFALVAAHTREGGLDGVEIHGVHGYLIEQFMSPLTNKRNDEYGGSLKNRMRFVLEIIDAVRASVGEDFTVGIRISGDEFAPGGIVLEEAKEIAKILEGTGKLDYISVSGGVPWSSIGISSTLPMCFPPGFYRHLAAGVKEVVESIPIFAIGPRINDPIMAEQILADGQADMVGMTRALICDPELPNKALEGRLDDIRHCTGCSQGCGQRYSVGLPITCVQNPAAGREKRLGIGTLQPAAKSKRLVVIGGGPSGLKVSEIAARRGHKVVLYEKEQELGGQVRLAAKTPTREEFEEITRYLINQIKKLGVEIHLGVEADLEKVSALKPDAVVVANGLKTTPRTAMSPTRCMEEEIPGAKQENVVSVWDVLSEKVEVGRRVVIVDDEQQQKAVSIAQWLAERGKDVEIITYQSAVGMRIWHGSDPFFTKRLIEQGVKVTTSVEIKEISGSTIILFDRVLGAEKRIEGIDTVVWAMCEKPDDELYFRLKTQLPDVQRIGDCVTPRSIEHAIWEGEQVGRAL